MPSKEEERAERLFRQQQDAPKAVEEYREATRKLTAKLRDERLAREAIHGKPKPAILAKMKSGGKLHGQKAKGKKD